MAGKTRPTVFRLKVRAAAGSYSVIVSNFVGFTTSGPVLVTVSSVPIITGQPQSRSVLTGEDAVFTVTAFGPGPLGYQWSFNGRSITETSSVLVVTKVDE